jgi:hypothetical protein
MGDSAPVGMSIASHKAALVDLEGKFAKNMGQVAREVELFAGRLDRMDGVSLLQHVCGTLVALLDDLMILLR